MHVLLYNFFPSINCMQTIDRLKYLLNKENITYSIDIFYSKEGLQSLDREPFSVCIIYVHTL